MERVLETIEAALELGVKSLKLNCVIMRGVNEDEVSNFVRLTKDKALDVRFIEYMPFSGKLFLYNQKGVIKNRQ